MVNIWKRLFQILIFKVLISVGLSFSISSAYAQQLTVVELFTSQGCSSCPPADKFLGDLAKRNDIIPLTLHVDYWDYLGWKDTLAKSQYSNRQRKYARFRGDGQVYTPQIVVNGINHVVGSNQSRVNYTISQAIKTLKPKAISMSMQSNNKTIEIKVGASKDTNPVKSATVWLAYVTKKISVAIRRGENGGRKITYYNVVRELMPIGQWSGEELNLKLPQKDLLRDNIDSFVTLLQSSQDGQIIAASQLNNS